MNGIGLVSMLLNKELIERIAEELAPYADDIDVFWDTLDGETDVMDVVGTLLENIATAEADMEAVVALLDKFSDRVKTIRNRRDRLKSTLQNILVATGQKKIPHPFATVSMRKGSQRLIIENDEDIPSQLCKVIKSPDRAEIKKHLLAGEKIDGCVLVNSPDTISIRMK